ncbi:uncharacterized protein C8R40DRAFT_1263838, partial [Lentinula edodes]|uniref:uncharacterized protein n=1 Tax=Lentinula edodes TaxID=5353 RepID=UPI001E8D8767
MKTPTRPSVPVRPTPSSQYLSSSPQRTPSSRLLSSPLDCGPIFAAPTAESACEPRDDDGLGPNGCLQVSLMDPLLCNSYRMIKNLRSVVLYPVGNDSAPSEDCDWESFSAVFKRLPGHQQRSLMNSVLFESRGGWFNPARADPSLLKLNSKNLPATISPILKPQFPALCLTTGIVQKCSIIQPSILHLGNGQTRTVREVLVKGFAQESQRAFAFFGKIFGFDSVSVAASAGVVSYSSMQLFQNQKKDNPNDFSPTKLARSYCPERYAESDPRLKLYGHFRLPVPFPSQILIFDGRRAATDLAFECEANQLHEIAINSYPLYQNGDVDLPDGAIVTVGYTAHTYATKSHYRDVPVGLSLDLAFIVLLALPSDLRDPIPQPAMSSYSNTTPHIRYQTPSNSFTPVNTLS